MFSIVPATKEHWDELAKNMRPEIVDEIMASHGHTPDQVAESLSPKSDDVLALMWDDKLMGITGLHRYSYLSDYASPWFLATNEAPKHPREIMRTTKVMIEKWLTQHPILVNYIDARFEQSLRWAKWAGYTIGEEEPYGYEGKPFRRIEIRSN
ncbi:MAG: hypothetical protein ACXABY_07700 [Candidatus Thorarchaeota archaeon]|jgi:hypothetical protein